MVCLESDFPFVLLNQKNQIIAIIGKPLNRGEPDT